MTSVCAPITVVVDPDVECVAPIPDAFVDQYDAFVGLEHELHANVLLHKPNTISLSVMGTLPKAHRALANESCGGWWWCRIASGTRPVADADGRDAGQQRGTRAGH